MITKIGKKVAREERMSEDEANAMRRIHLIKGVLTPVVAAPAATVAGGLVGSAVGAPAHGALIGGLAATGLGIRHLYNSAATREALQREKERDSIIDW